MHRRYLLLSSLPVLLPSVRVIFGCFFTGPERSGFQVSLKMDVRRGEGSAKSLGKWLSNDAHIFHTHPVK